MADARSQAGRPLSPHLQIYRPMLTMMMSIVHRITGSALYFGSLLLAAWLIAAASGPDAYDLVSGIAGSIPGKLVLFGYTWALLHHMFGGFRHFIWDTGRGFDLATIEIMTRVSLVAALLTTVALWLFGYFVMGVL
jgi:succinate dehydrogenase / fumarate reductase cytochrome b subunit